MAIVRSTRSVLDGVDLEVGAGECVALQGPSGSGKTSLLHVIAGLLGPDAGVVEVAGSPMTGLSERRRAALRLGSVGMVFQFGDLIPELSVSENVELPLRLGGHRRPDRCSEVLEAVGLAERMDALPEELSGGEVQRAAIARALVGEPSVLLADEPTGALDEKRSDEVVSLLIEHARTLGAALLVATHDPRVATRMDRRLRLRGGRIEPAA